MKNILILLALAICCVSTARAETMTIGKSVIAYDVPEGYVALQRGRNPAEDYYIDRLIALHHANGTSVAWLFVNKEWHERIDDAPELDEYGFVFSLDSMKDDVWDAEMFAIFRASAVAGLNQNNLTETGTPWKISDRHIKNSPSAVGYEQTITAEEGGRTTTMINAVHLLNIDGKVVGVTYNKQFDSPKTRNAALERNAALLEGLNLRLVSGPGPQPKESMRATRAFFQILPVALGIIVGVTAFVALMVWLATRFLKMDEPEPRSPNNDQNKNP